MNKKNKLIIFLYVLVVLLFLSKNIKGTCSLTLFETEKDVYYNNERIKINANWGLSYNPPKEYAYIQIQIFDIYNNLLWNSSEYDEMGLFEESWTIEIQNFNISFMNLSCTLYVKFFYFLNDEGNFESSFRGTLAVEIIKREIKCELSGYKSILKYGENLMFTAKFSDKLNNSALIDLEVLFQIKSNNITLFQFFFLTNQSGEIQLNVSSVIQLSMGRNILIFSVKNNSFYNDSVTTYYLTLEKVPVIIEISKYEEIVERNEVIEIELLFYYFNYFNSCIESLNGSQITILIYNNGELQYKTESMTNDSGILEIIIPLQALDINWIKNKISIDIIYNGTEILSYKALTLNIEIILPRIIGNLNSVQLTTITIFAVIGIFFTLFALKTFNKRRSRCKVLSEISFRY